MRCVDVNVLVYAHRPESPDHERYAAWLEAVRAGDEPLAVPRLCLSGFLRIVTHPRVFRDPTPMAVALDFAEGVGSSPNHLPVVPGERHWEIFTRLCRSAEVVGNVVPDAYLAAMAIERGATLCTTDRGFGRFAGLRWTHPFDDAPAPGGPAERPGRHGHAPSERRRAGRVGRTG